MNLLQDASSLSRSGHLATSSALTLIRTLHGVETTSLVWEELLDPLFELSDVWWEQSEEVQQALIKLRREMVTPVVERLGWEEKEGESEDEKELRWLALGAAAWAGEAEYVETALRAEIAELTNPLLPEQSRRRVQTPL